MIIDGKLLAEEIMSRVATDVAAIKKGGHTINFVAVMVGDNPASIVYVNRKQKACEAVGINMRTVKLDAETTQKKLNDTLAKLSADKDVHGMLLQLPVAHLDAREAVSYILPAKDVDGLTAENFGHLATENARLAPCTALGIIHVLKSNNIEVAGKDVVVIGRSNIVGKPVLLLLTAMDATVTLCHSKTKDLKKHTRKADIVIVAAGCPKLLRGDMVKRGVAVIDVGINRLSDGSLCGDVDFQRVAKKAALITPVPGGIGPLTIAFLLSNIVQAYTCK